MGVDHLVETDNARSEGDAGPSGPHLLPSGALDSSSLAKDSPEERVTTAPLNPTQPGEELGELELEGTAPPVHHDSPALSPLLPEEAGTKHPFSPRKQLPSLKQVNLARKQLKPTATSTATIQRAGSQPASGPGLFSSSTEKPHPPGDPDPVVTFEPSSEVPFWLDEKEDAVPTTPAPLQISPFTSQPYAAHTLPQKPDPREPNMPVQAQEAAPEDASPMSLVDKGENELTGSASEESQETTTSTIITTTVITTEQAPALCSVSFSDPEGYIDSSDYPTVYTGYGVELQVKSVNLSDGELLSIRGVDGPTLTVLANQTLLVEGQVIRSPTNTISVYFRTFQDDGLGTFQLHYQ
ncbi:PREDICTED: seizure 6-like protein, partial [Galeopterus variegatus]|uniref:Seizure 6-like protein n=1 Tax=Galeopterus variegatus TaxID=482537 RepID=A0ABM0R1T8_GALVR